MKSCQKWHIIASTILASLTAPLDPSERPLKSCSYLLLPVKLKVPQKEQSLKMLFAGSCLVLCAERDCTGSCDSISGLFCEGVECIDRG